MRGARPARGHARRATNCSSTSRRVACSPLPLDPIRPTTSSPPSQRRWHRRSSPRSPTSSRCRCRRRRSSNHRNAHRTGNADAAIELACVVGRHHGGERTDRRSSCVRCAPAARCGSPPSSCCGSADDGAEVCGDASCPTAGHGVAVVVADEHRRVAIAAGPARRTHRWMAPRGVRRVDRAHPGRRERRVTSHQITELHRRRRAASLEPVGSDRRDPVGRR